MFLRTPNRKEPKHSYYTRRATSDESCLSFAEEVAEALAERADALYNNQKGVILDKELRFIESLKTIAESVRKADCPTMEESDKSSKEKSLLDSKLPSEENQQATEPVNQDTSTEDSVFEQNLKSTSAISIIVTERPRNCASGQRDNSLTNRAMSASHAAQRDRNPIATKRPKSTALEGLRESAMAKRAIAASEPSPRDVTPIHYRLAIDDLGSHGDSWHADLGLRSDNRTSGDRNFSPIAASRKKSRKGQQKKKRSIFSNVAEAANINHYSPSKRGRNSHMAKELQLAKGIHKSNQQAKSKKFRKRWSGAFSRGVQTVFARVGDTIISLFKN